MEELLIKQYVQENNIKNIILLLFYFIISSQKELLKNNWSYTMRKSIVGTDTKSSGNRKNMTKSACILLLWTKSLLLYP